MTDQVFHREPYSKRLLEVSKSSLIFAAFLYGVLLVIGLAVSLSTWDLIQLLEMQSFLIPFCGGVFVLGVAVGFRRCKNRALQPEQMRFEDGALHFNLAGKDVELTSSKMIGVNQHYSRNRDGNIITWLFVYDIRTTEGKYRIDLTCYERNNGAGNWLLHCNRERNREKVLQWQAAEQAFRISDRVVFGTKRERIVFEQQPPSITLGNSQLDLSVISRVVIDPTVGGRGPLNQRISFMQRHEKEKTIASLPCRVVENEWDSFLQHLFAIAKRVDVPVELITEGQRDVSQVPTWW